MLVISSISNAQTFDENGAYVAPSSKDETTKFPKAPEEANLKVFSPSAAGNDLAFYLDAKSLHIISEDSIQFTVVIRSKNGAKQTVFAGINCNSSQWRQYGFLEQDGKWRENTNPAWRPLPNLGLNQYATYLARAGLCQGAGPNYDSSQAIRSIQFQALPAI